MITVIRVCAFLGLVALAASAMGCTTTQKVASGAGVGAVTGFALGGPVGAGTVSYTHLTLPTTPYV